MALRLIFVSIACRGGHLLVFVLEAFHVSEHKKCVYVSITLYIQQINGYIAVLLDKIFLSDKEMRSVCEMSDARIMVIF
jgi:hypothetical protein